MWIHSLLRDGHDQSLSSKRVVTCAAFILCVISFLLNQILGLSVEQFMFDSMMYVVMVGLGAIASEKFTKPKDTQ